MLERHVVEKGMYMNKILYISDLDGTLLHSDETTSDYTNNTLNRLTQNGLLFSYATARSIHTAKKADRKSVV